MYPSLFEMYRWSSKLKSVNVIARFPMEEHGLRFPNKTKAGKKRGRMEAM